MKISSLLATRKIIQGFIVQTLYWIFCGGLESNFENKVGRGRRWTVEGPGGDWMDRSPLDPSELLSASPTILHFSLHVTYILRTQKPIL